MKFKYLLFLLFSYSSLFAQTNLPNLNFESAAWGSPEDLLPPYATLNELQTFSAPQTVYKDTDAKQGMYAAKLVTQSYGIGALSILMAGLVATGEFTPDLTNIANSLKQGTPFTGRPDSLTGWFKYVPVAGDSAVLVLSLTKNSSGSRDTIGVASKYIYSAVPTYTYFSIPVNYTSSATPDSIILIFTSSAGGGSSPAVGSVGSTLWIDDIKIVYNGVGINESELQPSFVQVNNNQLQFNRELTGSLQLIDNMGKKVYEVFLNKQLEVSFYNLSTGLYHIVYNGKKIGILNKLN